MDDKTAWIAYRKGDENIRPPANGWFNEQKQEELLEKRLVDYRKAIEDRAKAQPQTPLPKNEHTAQVDRVPYRQIRMPEQPWDHPASLRTPVTVEAQPIDEDMDFTSINQESFDAVYVE